MCQKLSFACALIALSTCGSQEPPGCEDVADSVCAYWHACGIAEACSARQACSCEISVDTDIELCIAELDAATDAKCPAGRGWYPDSCPPQISCE